MVLHNSCSWVVKKHENLTRKQVKMANGSTRSRVPTFFSEEWEHPTLSKSCSQRDLLLATFRCLIWLYILCCKGWGRLANWLVTSNFHRPESFFSLSNPYDMVIKRVSVLYIGILERAVVQLLVTCSDRQNWRWLVTSAIYSNWYWILQSFLPAFSSV